MLLPAQELETIGIVQCLNTVLHGTLERDPASCLLFKPVRQAPSSTWTSLQLPPSGLCLNLTYSFCLTCKSMAFPIHPCLKKPLLKAILAFFPPSSANAFPSWLHSYLFSVLLIPLLPSFAPLHPTWAACTPFHALSGLYSLWLCLIHHQDVNSFLQSAFNASFWIGTCLLEMSSSEQSTKQHLPPPPDTPQNFIAVIPAENGTAVIADCTHSLNHGFL